MKDKYKISYRVIPGRNPKTGLPIRRPIIVNRDTLSASQVVEFALKNGYARGQYYDIYGSFNGVLEASKELLRQGKAINLGWLRIHAELTGTVDETQQLTAANMFRVLCTSLLELKENATDYACENVGDTGVVPKIDTITYNGCPDNWKIKKSEAFTATGRNLIFNASLGDTVTAKWTEEDEEKTATLTPSGSGYSFMSFNWPTAFAGIPAGTEITLEFTLHAGVEGGAAFAVTKSVELIA